MRNSEEYREDTQDCQGMVLETRNHFGLPEGHVDKVGISRSP